MSCRRQLGTARLSRNAKAPDGGFRLMIAMRCDKVALFNRCANPLARLATPIGGMSNRDRLVVCRVGRIRLARLLDECSRIDVLASSGKRRSMLWI
jgi:hypothetical protein